MEVIMSMQILYECNGVLMFFRQKNAYNTPKLLRKNSNNGSTVYRFTSYLDPENRDQFITPTLIPESAY